MDSIIFKFHPCTYSDHTCDSASCKDASSDSEFTHWNDGCGDSELLMINVAIVGRRRDYHRGARVHIQAAADAQTHVCYEVHCSTCDMGPTVQCTCIE